MIVSNYTKLFSVEILHDFYIDHEDICKDINIIPDAATMKMMNGYRLCYRMEHNRLLCFVQTIAAIETSGGITKVNVVNKPLINFDEKTILNFRIYIQSPQFVNTSNLRRYYSKDKYLRFGNDSGNKRDEILSLSHKIPAYKTSEIYKPGMLVTNSGDQSFEAIKESDPVHPQNTTKIQFWSHITDFVQYANQSDLINDTTEEKCFALISISFKKNLTNKFSLLKKSAVVAEDNTILGKDYIIHFKNNEAN